MPAPELPDDRESTRTGLPPDSLSTGSNDPGNTPTRDEVERYTPAGADTGPPPTHFGEYPVVRELGRGGMGVVYEARDPTLNRNVAIKVMSASRAADPRAKQRFLREGRAAAAVASDHVVTVHRVGEHDGRPFLVMELLRGANLGDWLAGRALTPADAVRVARDVLNGLTAAHALTLVHRDIKPANLWVTTTGRVKLLDFGLTTRDADDDGTTLTHEGSVLGTPAYMAPEQVDGNAEPRSDLFSLGVVLYAIFAGKSPFQRATTTGTCMAVATLDPPAPPGCPAPLWAFVQRLLAKKPEHRPASATAALAELEAVQLTAAAPPVPRRSAIGRGVKLAALAAVIAAALGLYLATKTPSGPATSQNDTPKVDDAPPVEPLPPAVAVLASVPLPELPPPVEREKGKGRRVAFLVGVGKYRHNFPDLAGIPQRDAAALARTFELAGYTVVALTDDEATRAGVRKQFEQASGKLTKDDTLVVVLAAHGFTLPVPGGAKDDAYFVPHDGRADDPETMVGLDWFLSTGSRSGATVLYLLDLCREIQDLDRCEGDADALDRVIPRNTAILFSCSRGQVSHQSGKLRHSVFVYALLRVMNGEQGRAGVSWSELVQGVEKEFRSPEIQSLLPPGHGQTPVEAKSELGPVEVLGPARAPRGR